MARYNLIDEGWIPVVADDKGSTKEVSLRDFFKNAHKYIALAGDSQAQDFAVMRVILAILHTVFSRFDSKGKPYNFFAVDDSFMQIEDLDEDDLDDYNEALLLSWDELWLAGKFPDIIVEYLDIWHDRFYLFDEKYPFFQVTKEDIDEDKISKKNPSSVSAKNINRLISESGNKKALFSPRYERKNNKDLLTESELARWLISFQGYTGLSDKVIFGNEKYEVSNSKGWLYDLGGLYLTGNNLYESLLLNLTLVHPVQAYRGNRQKPCWEYSSKEILQGYSQYFQPNNLAGLYTNWSRAIYIDPDTDMDEPFSFEIVKLPEIDHQNQFLEIMTLWRYNKQGENKDTFTPRKHQINQSLWRSFGLLTKSFDDADEKAKKPGIMDWLDLITNYIGDYSLGINAVGMESDGNATSWVPVDDVFDSLKVNDLIVTDLTEDGWVPRINEAIERTKYTIDSIYRGFLLNIKEIRNQKSNDFVNLKVEEMYFAIDRPFRDWLESIEPGDSKDGLISQWFEELYNIISTEARLLVEEAGPRDYTGIEKDGRLINIATAFNIFVARLNRELNPYEEVKDA